MLQRLDGYIKAIWSAYRLPGVIAAAVAVIVLVLVTLVVLQLVLGVDVSGYVNRLLGVS